MSFMFIVLLIILGITTRLIPHLSQFTAVLAVAMFAGMYLSRQHALLISLTVMVITDVILGFHDTMLYTYGSMAVIVLLGGWLKGRKNFFNVLGGSFASSLIFFVITNFGAWLSLYPRTLAGFMECYTMAIPFFRTTVFSTVAYSLVLFAAYEWLYQRAKGTSLARLF